MGDGETDGVAERLRALRESVRLTRTALAEPKYTVSYVSQIEAGRRTPSAEAIEYFAEKLGTSARYLATGVPDGAEAEIAYDLEGARVALRGGQPADALETARVLVSRAGELGLASLRGQAMIVHANALFLLGRYREAIDRYEDALETNELSDRERGMTTNALAAAYRTVGDLAYAADIVESYLRVGRDRPLDANLLAELNSTLVSIYFERGDVTRAEMAAERALAMADERMSPEARANALWSASRSLAERREFEQALELATRARIILEELNDRRRVVRIHTAYAFLCLEADPPRLSEAERYLGSALTYVDEAASHEDVAYLYAERARHALLAERPADALEYSAHALDHAGIDELERGRCLFLHGRALAALGRHPDAIGYFREGAAVFAKRGARQQEASCWREIGEMQLEAGRPDEALLSLREGLEALDPRRSRT